MLMDVNIKVPDQYYANALFIEKRFNRFALQMIVSKFWNIVKKSPLLEYVFNEFPKTFTYT